MEICPGWCWCVPLLWVGGSAPGVESPSTPACRWVPLDICEAPKVLPLERPPAPTPIIIDAGQVPRRQVRPAGQDTPSQFTSLQTPPTQAFPIGQGIAPQDSGRQAPLTHTWPVGHETPTQLLSTQVVIPTQTWLMLQVASGHVGGKHAPFTHTFEP